MLAAFDLDSAGAEDASERANSFQGATMKTKDGGGAKLERALGLKRIIDSLDDFVVLTEAVLCFLAGFLLRVGNQLDFESFAMALFVRHVCR
jgi:hypothetical protein